MYFNSPDGVTSGQIGHVEAPMEEPLMERLLPAASSY